MPNRMLRDWTFSDRINQLSVHAERFFVRLIMKVDDYGCFPADTRILKASLFPLLLDSIREADISRWMAECANTTSADGQKAGLIVVYEAHGKKYLQIQDFKQRLDKSASKYPLPTSGNSLTNVTDFPAEREVEREVEKEKKNYVGNESENFQATKLPASQPSLIPDYSTIEKTKSKLVEYIRTYRPQFAEPYKDCWNLFAEENGFPKVSELSEARKQKVKKRVRRVQFDFLAILRAAKYSSAFFRDSNWFSFDWIFKNDENYLKVLEGNYKDKQNANTGTSPSAGLSEADKRIIHARNLAATGTGN